MASIDRTDLPPGISVHSERWARVDYVGADDAFIAAGMLNPAWIIGLGRFMRSIAVDAAGGFVILGEGKGNRVKHCHRENGAWGVGRLADGRLLVARYRTVEEEAAIKRDEKEQMERERARNTWECAKEARLEANFPTRWKDGVLQRVQEVIDFLDGRLVFTGFPSIRIDKEAAHAAKEAAALLGSCIGSLAIQLDDVDVMDNQSNVISLKDRAYWNMARKNRAV